MEKDNFYSQIFYFMQNLEYGQGLYLIGSNNDLGNWDVNKGLPMKNKYESLWILKVNIRDIQEEIEYNFFISDFDYVNLKNIKWVNQKNNVINQNDYEQQRNDQSEKSFMDIISYNIRCENSYDGKDKWKHRKKELVEMLKNQNSDIICFQEVTDNQYNELGKNLTQYKYYGYGRDYNFKGEACPIFYNKHRFFAVKSRQIALSDTPNVPGSITFGNKCPRILTYVHLQNLKGVEDDTNHINYLIFNTHLDHISMDSRTRMSRVILDTITEELNNLGSWQFSETLILITGDFNADFREECIKIIQDNGFLSSSITFNNNEYTFNNFSDVASYKIDHIFYRNVKNANEDEIQMRIKDYKVIKEKRKNGRQLSDHFPIKSEFNY